MEELRSVSPADIPPYPTSCLQATLPASAPSCTSIDNKGQDQAYVQRPRPDKQRCVANSQSVSFSNLRQTEDGEDLEDNDIKDPRKGRKITPGMREPSRELLTGTAKSSVDLCDKKTARAQLETPPDSGYRLKRKSATAGNMNKETINSPSKKHSKGASRDSSIQSTQSQYQGYTTTENDIKLSQTTMERLNTFRYKNPQTEYREPFSSRSTLSPDYKPNYHHLGVLVANVDQGHKALGTEFGCLATITHAPNDKQASDIKMLDNANIEELPCLHNVQTSTCQKKAMPKRGLMLQTQKDVLEGYMLSDGAEALAEIEIQPAYMRKFCRSNIPLPGEGRKEDSPEPKDITPITTPRQKLSPEDNYNKAPTEKQHDFIETHPSEDEFDDGINDDDILAAVAECVPPLTRLGLPTFEASHNQSTLQKPPTQTATLYAETLTSHPSVNCNGTPQISLNEEHNVEQEDEFPLDNLTDDDLLTMLDLASGTEERFVAPTSVQHSHDEDREVYDSSLQFSPPKPEGSQLSDNLSAMKSTDKIHNMAECSDGVEENWSFIRPRKSVQELKVYSKRLASPSSPVRWKKPIATKLAVKRTMSTVCTTSKTISQETEVPIWEDLDDTHEYEPLKPFARTPFPSVVVDRSPVLGLSADMFLRTCFRIGEMFQQGVRCNVQKKDAVIELFARVNFSSREPGTTKQHFQFLDLWNDRAPYPNGILANFKATRLIESESKVFLDRDEIQLARVLGRLKRDKKTERWLLQIISIRKTDWEEIRWTKRIICGDDIAKRLEASGTTEGWLGDLLG